jgi:hypothetical protein
LGRLRAADHRRHGLCRPSPCRYHRGRSRHGTERWASLSLPPAA